MDEPLTLRPEVAAFAQLMEVALRAYDDNRGVRSWQDESEDWLFDRVRDEVAELREALVEYWSEPMREREPEHVICEAVDVANFAMMIADVLGGLELRHG